MRAGRQRTVAGRRTKRKVRGVAIPAKIRRVDFYQDDWLSGTFELSFEERGIYITVCALIYNRGGPVSRELVYEHGRHHRRPFERIVNRLIDLGKLVEKDGKLDQNRCETELKRAQNRLETLRKNGEKGGRPSKIINGLEEPKGFGDKKDINHQPTTINQITDSDKSESDAERVTPEVQKSASVIPIRRESVPESSAARFWNHNVAILKELGINEREARSIIGGWRKKFGETEVSVAIEAAHQRGVSDARSYITACLTRSTIDKVQRTEQFSSPGLS